MGKRKLWVLSLTTLFLFGCNVNSGSATSRLSSDSSEEDLSERTSEPEKDSSSFSSDVDSSYDISSDSGTVEETVYAIAVVGNASDGTAAESSSFESAVFTASGLEKVFYSGTNGQVRLGSGSGTGKVTFTSEAMKIKSIVIDTGLYGNDADVGLKVELSDGENLTETITGDGEVLYTFGGEEDITSFTISTIAAKKRALINGIRVSSSNQSVKPADSSSVSSVISSSLISSSANQGTTSSAISIVTGDISDPSNDPYSGTYYTDIENNSKVLKGDELVRALSAILNSTYKNRSYAALWEGYAKTDIKPGTGNVIWDMYSNVNYTLSNDQCGNYSKEGDCYNREHSVPKSWFDEKAPMVYDIYHVVPTDGYVNGKRSNYPFGEVGTATYTSENGSKLGTSNVSGISGTVFEPIDEYKGDFARIYFYMATCYYGQVGNWSGGVFKGTYPYLNDSYFQLYLKWALEDPVSEKEIQRNEGGFEFQGNRNPYVDHPSYLYRAFIAE